MFNRIGVEYLIVGGVAAQLHGVSRPTLDFDSIPSTTVENLRRLAAAMSELNARLRVEGMSDDDARGLPVRLDSDFLARMEISTWRTDAGDLDVLTTLPTRSGERATYDQLVGRASRAQVAGGVVLVASLSDIIASKEWADRPKDREALVELRGLPRIIERSPSWRLDSVS
ncbi:MAG: hypothetical protein ACSLFB_10030 [Acidimicrobiales bacterium]